MTRYTFSFTCVRCGADPEPVTSSKPVGLTEASAITKCTTCGMTWAANHPCTADDVPCGRPESQVESKAGSMRQQTFRAAQNGDAAATARLVKELVEAIKAKTANHLVRCEHCAGKGYVQKDERASWLREVA